MISRMYFHLTLYVIHECIILICTNDRRTMRRLLYQIWYKMNIKKENFVPFWVSGCSHYRNHCVSHSFPSWASIWFNIIISFLLTLMNYENGCVLIMVVPFFQCFVWNYNFIRFWKINYVYVDMPYEKSE